MYHFMYFFFLIKLLFIFTSQSILDATVLNYEKFRLVADQQDNLRIVEIAGWAGLGAVQ